VALGRQSDETITGTKQWQVQVTGDCAICSKCRQIKGEIVATRIEAEIWPGLLLKKRQGGKVFQ